MGHGFYLGGRDFDAAECDIKSVYYYKYTDLPQPEGGKQFLLIRLLTP